MSFVHIHHLPRRCRMEFTPISWPPKVKWYYNRSLVRYLRDPERQILHYHLNEACKNPEFGVYESFRFILSNLQTRSFRVEEEHENRRCH